MKKRYFIDMDGTLAKWNPVAEEQLFEKGYFRNLEPNKEMLDFAKYLLSQKEDVFILSAYLENSNYALYEKNSWIEDYCPEIDMDHRLFVPFGTSKSLFFDNYELSPITQNDILVDDYTLNLIDWEKSGGTGIKYLNGINHSHQTWSGILFHNSCEEMIESYNQLDTVIMNKSNIRNSPLYYRIDGASRVPEEERQEGLFYFELRTGDSSLTTFIGDHVSINNEGNLIANRDILQDAIDMGIISSRNDELDSSDLRQIYSNIQYMDSLFIDHKQESSEEISNDELEME